MKKSKNVGKRFNLIGKIYIFLFVFFFCFGVTALIGMTVESYTELVKKEVEFDFYFIYDFILCGGFCLLLMIYSWENFSALLAKYDFSKEGITIKYPFRKSELLKWEEFQQVCLCYANYTTRGERKANDVICLVKNGEKPNIIGRWKIGYLFHYKSVIPLSYTDELYEEVKEKCPYEVVDLRKTRTYRL